MLDFGHAGRFVRVTTSSPARGVTISDPTIKVHAGAPDFCSSLIVERYGSMRFGRKPQIVLED
jgi:hypothetical protein